MSIGKACKEIDNLVETFLKNGENTTEQQFRSAYSAMLDKKNLWQYMMPHKYGAFLLGLLFLTKKYDGIGRALDLIEELYGDYDAACKYDYVNKSYLHDRWAKFLVEEDLEDKAYEHLKKATYYMLIDNVSYDGFEFFSFRNFSDYALDDIKNNTICLAHPSTFNDPMDTILLRWNQNAAEKASDETEKKLRLLYQKVYDHIKVRCFVRTDKLPRGEDDVPIVKKQEIEDVNPLMWAHYANYHRGFCIKYKFLANTVKSENEERLILTRIGNVNYQATMKFDELKKFTVFDALFSKHDIWAYEQEVRLVHYDPNNEGNFKTVEIPENSIQEIYLGLKCSDENREKMKLILRNKNIRLYQMKVDSSDSYKLVKERIL